MKKNKMFKKAMSLLLSLAIIVGTFSICLPFLKIDAGAITTTDGETVTQTAVVSDSATVYSNYATYYLNGAGESTGIIIPGLADTEDYVIQGMAYYPQKDWMLVTAYHNDGTYSSKVFCLDAATGEFVAMLSFLNTDGSPNLDHGGGIAISENNIYYSCGDQDRSIAYAPLSLLDGFESGYKEIQLVDEIEFYEIGSITSSDKTAYSAYVCYDQGYLWMGNFYDIGTEILGVQIAADYNVGATSQYRSMVYGYKLEGSNSTEEWNYLKGTYANRLSVTTTSGSATSNGSNHLWTAQQNGESITIVGSISAPTAYVGEFTGSFASATLTEGETYKIEFDSTNDKSDMYMFSPAGTHCNVKQSSATTITQNADGTYHYSMTFTAGLKPTGADSSWPTTQSTDGTYTGTYTLRFDQDAIEAGESRDYKITNARISTYKDGSYSYEAGYRGTPSHAIALDNNIKDVQYAVVDDGKLYLSRSYGSGAGNSVSFGFGETSTLTIADIDLSATPTTDVTISVSSDNGTTKNVKAHLIDEYENYPMMPMSEGLCIVNDLIFLTFESASNKYMNESDGLTSIGNCEKPVDVIWKIDPYALENEVKVVDTPATHYEKVNSLSEIEDGEEYLIVYESSVKDPVTQKNILYAIDANGGYHGYRLSKKTPINTAGYVGAIGHPITQYDIEGNNLYLTNTEDDAVNVRWELNSLGGNSYSIQSPDYYFVNHPNFYCDASNISMATDAVSGTNMTIQEATGDKGDFWIANNQTYFLWCNDGTTASYNTAYNNYYTNSTVAMYSGVEEQPGTFHTDALNMSGSNVLGGAVISGADTNYAHGIFNIYKRVVDKTSSTYESRVYTDMTAELTSDGTYTINLETYAISPNHYQYVGERPTDYIFVMDASASATDSADGAEIKEWTENLYISSLCTETNTSDENGEGVAGYAFTNEQIYYLDDDGEYYRIYLAVNTTEIKKTWIVITSVTQYYWAYYIDADGMYNVLMSNNEQGVGTAPVQLTKDEFYTSVNNVTNYSGHSSDAQNGDRHKTIIYIGNHYGFSDSSDVYDGKTTTPLVNFQEKTGELIDKIVADGKGDRIAVTYYGASASYLGASGWATSGFTDAFWEANSTNASTLKTQINNIASSTQTDDTGMEFAFANSIMDNSVIDGSPVDYTADGTRNCVIVFMSDGVPGADANSATATAADNVIAKAYTAKNNGAFIYSTVAGANSTSFDTRTYMDAVSSKYPAATSMTKVDGVYTELGGSNVDGVEYVSNLSNCSIYGYIDYSTNVHNELVKNDAVGLANLDVNSILYEELNVAFKPIIKEDGTLADGVTVTPSLVPGSFDKAERFTFDEDSAYTDSNIKVGYDATNKRRVTVTGYDYGEHYVSTGKTGNKLRITITGVLADEEADITNTSINNPSTTAIYQTDNSTDVFKYFPTAYFNIPTYTYVLDYDMPMYDSDINGTLCSVDGGLNKQSTYTTTRETDNVALKFTNSNLDMTYELVSSEYTVEDNRSFCLIQRDDGTYDWFRINIVPASNVLFEEGRFTATSTTSSFNKSSWSKQGTALKTQQTLSGDNDRYGYDEVYATNGAGYSNGTAYKTTVDSSTKKRSETMAFTYTGTGFDLMAACGPNTGIQMVAVKYDTEVENAETGATETVTTIEKLFMVDTYYVDTDDYASDDVLKQVPIINYTNANGYGTYTVEVTAAYLSNAQAVTGGRSSLANRLRGAYTVQDLLDDMDINVPASEVEKIWFNDNSILNGGRGPVATASGTRDTTTTSVSLDCYIDGIRVYNPLDDKTASSLYIDSEKGATYHNIVGELVSVDADDVITSDSGLFAYVVGDLEADSEGNVPTLSFANYQSVGPQHELYLQTATDSAESHAVAFNVTVPNSDSRVMISLRAVDGATAAKVASGDDGDEDADKDPIYYEINTATEQYYDITPYLNINETTGVASVIITNTGDGLLSVNNLKLVNASAQVVSDEDLSAMAMTFAMTPIRVEPNSYDYDAIVTDDDTQQPDVDEPTDDNNDVDDGNDVEVPVVVENIFTKIIAFIKKLFESIFSIF